jgi:hypothetical protein
MQKHSKKMVAPVVIAVLVIFYYALIIRMLGYLPLSMTVKVALLAIPVALIGGIAYVLWERIKEIRSGEEDDLSKY